MLGGRGIIGSHVVDTLLKKRVPVRILDRPAPAGSASIWANTSSTLLEVVEGDFTNSQDLEVAIKGCETCVHAITTTLPKTSNDDIAFDVSTNLLGTIKLLEHSARANLRRLVFLSSGGTIYGNPACDLIAESHSTEPTTSYGITKLAIEKYLRLFEENYGLSSVALRVSNPFGPRQRIDGAQGAVAVFLGAALRNRPISIWGDGKTTRDYIHVSDVVGAIIAALGYQGAHRVFNVGSGMGQSLLDVVDSIERATGRELVKTFLPARTIDVRRNVLDIGLAGRELNWRPAIDFDKGVVETASWLRDELKRGAFGVEVVR